MKLYSGPLSLFTAKVRIALDEKGVAYEKVDVPFSRTKGYEPKHPDVLAINPKGQVPVWSTRAWRSTTRRSSSSTWRTAIRRRRSIRRTSASGHAAASSRPRPTRCSSRT
jgi:hypothetical protein